MLGRARLEPASLVIGIDASATAMAESSLRAARPAAKGGLPNAVFVVAAAERPPVELLGIADEITVLFPWGSLLRGALALDDARDASSGIVALAAPGGLVTILVSVEGRDRLDIPPMNAGVRDGLAARWQGLGLQLTSFGPVDVAASSASGSSWARRLAASRDRVVWRIGLRRTPNLRRDRDLDAAADARDPSRVTAWMPDG